MTLIQSPPHWVCLFVDLSGSFVAGQWRQSTDRARLGMDLKFAYDSEEAIELISKLPVAGLVIATPKSGKDISGVLACFQDLVGCFSDFQAIVAEDPAPTDLASFYEFGVDRIFNRQNWQEDVKNLILETSAALSDPTSLEAKALTITNQIKHSRHIESGLAESDLGQSDFDHRAAFTRGKLRERSGDYDGASQAFSRARELNIRFIPASSKLAETFLILRKYDEAIGIFEELERKNPLHADRKASMATAYLAKGNNVRAEELMTEALALSPDNPRVSEARCLAALESKNIKLAMELLVKLNNLGVYMAQKLNNTGIELVREDRIEEALELYELAYKGVLPNIRYKIMMNAALACYKAGLYQVALQYLERCRIDHGSTFDKLERVRKNVLKALKDRPMGNAS